MFFGVFRIMYTDAPMINKKIAYIRMIFFICYALKLLLYKINEKLGFNILILPYLISEFQKEYKLD